MELVLMRHGHAVGVGQDPPLAAHGVAAVRATAAGPWSEPELLVHSPLLRAQQTAALLSERWPGATRLVDPAFVPSAAPATAARRLLELAAGRQRVLLVSHLPLLPALVEWCCGEQCAFEPADAVQLSAATDLAWRGTFERVVP